MGLRSRLKSRIKNLFDDSIGDGFRPEHDVIFARLDQNAEAAFQLIGASVVGTWEVGITDMARAYEGFLPEEEVPPLVERMSDAIVPFLTPVQGVGNTFRTALKSGVKDALGSGKLEDATRPMARVLWGLGEPVAEGWGKSTDYLDPLFEPFDDSAEVKARFHAASKEFSDLLRDEATSFAQAMDALPQASSLEDSINEALEAYRKNVAAGLEVLLYARRQDLVDAAKRMS